ncbi:MAG: hypothetical protein ACR2OH_11995, partial [Microthrixaceae bacterium]
MTQTDPAPGADSETPPPVGRPITHRSSLWWFNWTTVRGAALIIAGVAIIVSPERERMASTVAAFLLVLWAAGEIWNALLRPRSRSTSARSDAPRSGVPDSSDSGSGDSGSGDPG